MESKGKVLKTITYSRDQTELHLLIPSTMVRKIYELKINEVDVRLNDYPRITIPQRKKVYATIRDIALYTGYDVDECKKIMKCQHIANTGCRMFSLADCSMETAKEFLNTLTDFCLYNGVATQDSLLDRTDDVDTYLYQCLKHKKCCICGDKGETHHWDAIGMGNDRTRYDDSNNRKIELCRKHHTIAHQKGVIEFARSYHVYGIIYNGE